MRTFVALNLSATERGRLHASLEPLRQRDLPVRWTDVDALHLTLKFLGEIEGAEVARIDDALRPIAARHTAVPLHVGGLGAFPSLRRASILWLAVAPEPGLMSLQTDLELACSRLGYAREQRPFRPHLTVARARKAARPPDVERLASRIEASGGETVWSVDLMRSHPGVQGSSYESLLRWPLRVTEET
jgi:RNA 2',3'-cyclic 3'-phosphodiesterase